MYKYALSLSFDNKNILFITRIQFGAQGTPLYASAATSFPANFQHLYTQSQTSSTTPLPNQIPQAPQNLQQNHPAQVAANNAENAAPQRRFPNLVVEDPQEPRDWLDVSYTMFRLAVILTLIYFYSSPLRCLAVLSIGIALYLYRTGVFRNQIERNLNLNNNNNNNNNNNRPQQQLQDPQRGQAQQLQLAGENNVDPGTGGEQGDVVDTSAQDQNRTSMLVMIRTFIFSFIFSLIPETPAL